MKVQFFSPDLALSGPLRRSWTVLGDSRFDSLRCRSEPTFCSPVSSELQGSSDIRLGLTVCRRRWYGDPLRCMSVWQLLPRVVVYGFSGTSRRPSSLLIFSTRFSTGSSNGDGRASGSSLGFIVSISRRHRGLLCESLPLLFGSRRQQMAMGFSPIADGFIGVPFGNVHIPVPSEVA